MAKRKRQVQILVDVKTAKAIRSLRKMGVDSDRTFRKMARDVSKMNSGWRRFSVNLIAVNQGLQLMQRIGRATIGNLVRMTQEAREQNRVLADLAATLDRSGIGWAENSERALEFSAMLQRTAGIADNVTQLAMQQITAMGRGVLRTFDDVVNATEFVVNAATKVDQSVSALGRMAARVAAGDVGALRRSFAGLADELEILQDGGATSSELLEHMAASMRGAAAAGDVAHIQLMRLNASYGDVRESIGQIILVMLEESGVLVDLADKFDAVAESVADADSETGTFVRQGLSNLIGFAQAGTWVVQRLAQGFQAIAGGAQVASAQLELSFLQAELEFRERGVAGLVGAAGPLEGLIPLDAVLAAARDDLERFRSEHTGTLATTAANLIGSGLDVGFGDAPSAEGEARIDALQEVIRHADRQAQSQFADFTEYQLMYEEMIGATGDFYDRLQETIMTSEFDISDLGGERGTAPGAQQEEQEAGALRERSEAFGQSIIDSLNEYSLIAIGGSIELSAHNIIERLTEIFDGSEVGQTLASLFETGFSGILGGVDLIGDNWGDLMTYMAESAETASEEARESLVNGFDSAAKALRGFSNTIPRMMGNAAKGGADQVAAVFEFMGQAAELASAIGTAAQASASWLGPLSSFFGLAAAAASFAGSMGAGGGGGGGGTPTRGAVGAEAADVLVGQRPEAARMGQPRNIQMSIGSILATDDSRRQVRDWIVEMQDLNEITGVRVHG